MKKRRAISPILSVIILIGISLVGGGLLYATQNQVLTTGLSKLDIRITELKMQKDFNNSCYFLATVYNSGMDSITSIHLKTTLDNGEDFVQEFDNFSSPLVPRNSTEKSLFFSPDNSVCGNFTVSNTYSVRINASSFDSEISIVKPMKVENVTRT